MILRRHLNKLLIAFASLLFLTGCWDQKEIEERAYVIGIGLDKGEEDNLIKITYLISNPEFGSQQQGSNTNEPAHEIITFDTNDLITSKNLANAVIAKEISYDLLNIIIVSEDLARDKDFIRWIYDATKDREIRRDVWLIVSKEAASKFILETKPTLETRAHVYYDLIMKRGEETGIIPSAELLNYFRITTADADLFLAPYGTTEKASERHNSKNKDNVLAGDFNYEGKTSNTHLFGSAVFKEGRMIGTLTAEETRLSILLNETLEARDMLTTVPDPFSDEHSIAIKVMPFEKNDMNMMLNQTPPSIEITIPLNVEVLSDHSMVNYAINKEKREILKESMEAHFTKKFNKLIEKTQNELIGEPFGWSLSARKEFKTMHEYIQFDWMKTYPEMEIDVSVQITFTEFGRQSKLPSIQEVRD